ATARAVVAIEANRRRDACLATGRRAVGVRAAVRGHLGHVAAVADEHGRAAVGVLALEEARRRIIELGQLRLGFRGLGPSHVLLQGWYGDDREDAEDRNDDHQLDEGEAFGMFQLLDVDLLHAFDSYCSATLDADLV